MAGARMYSASGSEVDDLSKAPVMDASDNSMATSYARKGRIVVTVQLTRTPNIAAAMTAGTIRDKALRRLN
jgi:hypothetical protein